MNIRIKELFKSDLDPNSNEWWSKDKIDKINFNFRLMKNGGPLGPDGIEGPNGEDGDKGEISKKSIKGNNSKSAQGTVMVLVHCTPGHGKKQSYKVSSHSNLW